MCRSFVWFPVVGAAIGAVGAGVAFFAASFWSYSVAAILGVIALSTVTGGLHLDGFSDTVDGLASFQSSSETLQVMRDSRIGALGAGALFLLLGLKWALIESIPTHALLRTLVAACSLSRLSIVLSAQSFAYVPGEKGLGRLATDERSRVVVALALAVSIGIAVACVGPLRGFLSLVVAGAAVWLLNRLFLLRLGGITGDTLGAVSELVEVALLGFLTAR